MAVTAEGPDERCGREEGEAGIQHASSSNVGKPVFESCQMFITWAIL